MSVEMSRKQQNHLADSGDSDDDAEHEDGDEEEDYELSSKRRKLSQTNSSQVNEQGSKYGRCATIVRVIIKNFMCHDHLDFPFGPRINFIQGRNGSGKSAILSAVVVGLGGTSRTTNRGNSLKALIKNGKQTATVEITLSNIGPRAYKPEIFGNAVIVERKIHSTGGGGYKIKSINGKTVSCKKEDLLRILQHFNLQVDNPTTILNQDMARSFLNSSDPKNLFRFFMKATQLQQMEAEYELFTNNIKRSEAIIQSREENIPALRKEVEEWKAKHEYFCNLGSSEEKLRRYRKELAWAHVRALEGEVEESQKQLEAQEAALTRVSSEVAGIEQTVQEEKNKSRDIQKEFNDKMSVYQNMDKAIQATKANLRELVKEQHMVQCEVQAAEKEVRKFSKDAEGIREAIGKSQDSTKSTWAAKQAKRMEQIAQLREEVEKLEQEKRMVIHHLDSLRCTRDSHREDLEQQQLEEKAIKRRIHAIEQELQGLKRDKNDSFTVFGQWVPHLNKEIEKLHKKGSFSAKPVGPLGAYIKLRDQNWAHVAEMIIGRLMTAYCVNIAMDAKILKEVIKKVVPANHPAPHIIVSQFRDHVHDVRVFEVRSNCYHSLWSILEISEVVVANTLIDNLQVESLLLIPTAKEAGELLMHEKNVPPNCKKAYTLNGDTYHPDPNFKIYSGPGQGRAKFLQVSVEEKVSDLESDLTSTKEEVARINIEMSSIRNQIRGTESELGSYAKKEHLVKGKISELYGTIAKIEAEEEPMPPDVTLLEDDFKETEANKRRAQEKVESLKEKLAEMSRSVKAKKVDMECSKEELQNEGHLISQLKESLEDWGNKFDKNEKMLVGLRAKKKEISTKKVEIERNHKELVESLSNKSSDVEKNFGARTLSRRKTKDIERDYVALKQRLQQEKANHGDPLEVARKYQEKNELYRCFVAEIEQHFQLIKKLKDGLVKRNNHYYQVRRSIAVFMKYMFKIHMNTRKLEGKIRVDFEEGSLHILASRAAGGNSQKQKQSLPMMSGGERSFITVCFLLALWDCIDSPLRMLDEFDVFMDNVSRSQSLKLLSGAAQTKANCQFVFLTPLSLTLPSSNNVKIHKMPDPERNEDNQG